MVIWVLSSVWWSMVMPKLITLTIGAKFLFISLLKYIFLVFFWQIIIIIWMTFIVWSFECCRIFGWEWRHSWSSRQWWQISSLGRFSSMLFFLSLIFKTFIYIEHQYGHLEIVEFLFKKGANIDQESKDNQTPLFIATSVCIFLSFFPFLRQSKSDTWW